eukprot:m.395428 g.395428  ORF g.395428 m.395428 type:complete len:350 (-) comp16770_c2_seq12:15903-16952(-)
MAVAPAVKRVLQTPILMKVAEALGELGFLALGYAVLVRVLPEGWKGTAVGISMAALTRGRWSEPNRRLLALALFVRSLGLFQGLPEKDARRAIAAAFVATAGDLGRRYRGWPFPRPTLHQQFITVMSRLSGTGDAERFAIDPVALGQKFVTLSDWGRATLKSAQFAVPLMGTAYGLQEVLNYIFRSGSQRPPPDARSDLARASSPTPKENESVLRKYFVKVGRTSTIYVYLGMWTIRLAFNGHMPAPHEAGFFTLHNLECTAWMAMFTVFAYGEPVHRAAVLAEYYLTHWLFGLWSDGKYLAMDGVLPKWFLYADLVVLPFSAAIAFTCRPDRMPMGLLDWTAKTFGSL